MALPENLRNLKFDPEDCVIEVAQHPEKKRPVQFGISNGEIDYSQHPGEDMESIMNRVTVTHVPTRITATVNKFLVHRNKVIAMELVKRQVEEYIEKVKKDYERLHPDV
jgi:hypothetical protein